LPLRLARTVVVALAAAQLALYLALAVRTLAYPYPLEWMEGGTVDVVDRVVKGLPLYAPPSAEYVPYIYPPFYYWVSAQIARVAGVDFLAARLVSFASICVVFALIAAIVRRAGGDWIDALAAAGIFAGTYEATERWFHVARADSLLLALVLGGVYVLQFGTSRASAVLAGLIWFLAFLTKQTALVAVGLFVAIAAIREPARPVVAALVLAILAEAANLLMDARTDQWWSYYLYRLPALHGPAVHGSRWFWRYDMIPVLPLALLVTAGLVARALATRAAGWRWIAGLCAGGIAAAWIASLHSGGAANSMMPAYAALAIAMPLGVHALGVRPAWRLGGALLIAIQLALPLAAWTGPAPSAADRQAGDRFVEFLRGIDGEVINWHQRFVQTRAGKRSWGLEMAAEDVLRADDPNTRNALIADVVRVCREGRVAGVVDPPDWLLAAVPFGPPVPLFNDTTVFRPVSGAPKRPERYFPILHRDQPRQPGHDAEVHREAKQPERTAAER
jgi:hypothetical protein